MIQLLMQPDYISVKGTAKIQLKKLLIFSVFQAGYICSCRYHTFLVTFDLIHSLENVCAYSLSADL